MSRFSCGLTPSAPGVVIQAFRVSGLPDPVDGGDAVPLRYLEGTKVGNVRGVTVALNWVGGPVDNYAIAAHGLGSTALQVSLINSSGNSVFLAPWFCLDENRIQVHVSRSFSGAARAMITALVP